jgi:hypothetical protein
MASNVFLPVWQGCAEDSTSPGVADRLQLNLIQNYFPKMTLGNYTHFTRILKGYYNE